MTYTPVWCVPIVTLGDTAGDGGVSRVARVTGRTVALTDIAAAASSIETLTGLIEAVPRVDIHGNDLYWLGQGVAYQAPWLLAQADFIERNNVTDVMQGRDKVTYGPDALVLAPMARKCLRRLSWKGMRSVNLDRRLDPRDFRDGRYNRRLEQREAQIDAAFDAGSGGFGYNALADSSDEGAPWGPM